MEKVKNYFSDWNLFEKIWLFFFVGLELIVCLIAKDTFISLVAAVTGIISVVLCAKGKVSNYYFGIIQAICYVYLSYQARLFGEVMFSSIGLPFAIFGIINWKKNMTADNREVQAQNMSWKLRGIVLAATAVATFLYMLVLKALGGSFTLIDSCSTVLNLVAIILTMLRYTEQWVIWILVDVVSVIMWLMVVFTSEAGGDITVALMWFAQLINAVYGLINWSRLAKQAQPKEAKA